MMLYSRINASLSLSLPFSKEREQGTAGRQLKFNLKKFLKQTLPHQCPNGDIHPMNNLAQVSVLFSQVLEYHLSVSVMK